MNIWTKKPIVRYTNWNPSRILWDKCAVPEPTKFHTIIVNIWDTIRNIFFIFFLIIIGIAALSITPIIVVLLNLWIPMAGTAFVIGLLLILLLLKSFQ